MAAAVKLLQSRHCVRESDSPGLPARVIFHFPRAILHFQRQLPIFGPGKNCDLVLLTVFCNSVANGIFHQWLKDQSWNGALQSGRVNLSDDSEPVAKPGLLDSEIAIQQL